MRNPVLLPLASPGAMELLSLLLDAKSRSRGSLADSAGIARSTAGLRVDELVAAGLVSEGAPSYTGGRPSTKVQLVPRARIVMAADIGATHALVAIVDLMGTVIGESTLLVGSEDEPAQVLEWMLAEVAQLCESHDVDINLVSAAGLGLAAPIERRTGRPVDPPIMPRWRDFDVRTWLAPHVGVPVLVEKDVNIMALGEYVVSRPRHPDMIVAKISTGIGAGIIAGGRLQRGAQGLAGDVGHVRVNDRRDVPCRCGNSGCLEAVASGPAIAAELTRMGTPANTSQDVVDLVNNGDLNAIQLVRQAGRDVGEVLAMCVSLLNPSAIVLGGTLATAGEHLLAGVREAVYARSMPLATQTLSITYTSRGSSAAIRGAAAIALDHLLSNGTVDD